MAAMAVNKKAKILQEIEKGINYVNGQLRYIDRILLPSMTSSFKSKFGSHAYKDRKTELEAKYNEEYQYIIQNLVKVYELQRQVFVVLQEEISGGHRITKREEAMISKLLENIANIDGALEEKIALYPPRNTIPEEIVRPFSVRNRSRSRSPVRLNKQPGRSILRRNRTNNRNRSPTRNATRNATNNRNRNATALTKKIHFHPVARVREIERLNTGQQHPFESRGTMTHSPQELKEMKSRGYQDLIRMYGNIRHYKTYLQRYAEHPEFRRMIDEASTQAEAAAQEAVAAAREVEAVSPNAFPAARDAARVAVEMASDASSTFSRSIAQQARDMAFGARDRVIAIRNATQATQATQGSPRASAARSPNRRNST